MKHWPQQYAGPVVELHTQLTAEAAQKAKERAHSHQSLVRDGNGTQLLNIMIADSHRHRVFLTTTKELAGLKTGPVQATAPEAWAVLRARHCPAAVSTLRPKANRIQWDPAGLTVSDLQKTPWAAKQKHCSSGLHVNYFLTPHCCGLVATEPQSMHNPRPHEVGQCLPHSGCYSAGC